MLSYQHAFHAGNFADVLKHVVLLEVLDYLCQKPKPIRFIDTHAGAGLYPLELKHMQRLKEYRQGVEKVWASVTPAELSASNLNLPEPIQRYIQALKSWNPTPTLKRYPGSPALAFQQLRSQDQLHLAELHNRTFRQLSTYVRKAFSVEESTDSPKSKNTPKIFTFQTDGFNHLKAALPPQKGRACILIDPAYEVKSDYKTVVQAIQEGHKRCQTATFLIWYPIVSRQEIQRFKTYFKQAKLPNTNALELSVLKDHPKSAEAGSGMTGSGMILINAPWNLEERLAPALTFMAKTLSQEKPAFWKFEALVDENGHAVSGKRKHTRQKI